MYKNKLHKINQLLRDIRITNNISQIDISRQTGLSKQMISKMEHDEGNPTLLTLIKYCECIGVDLEKLLEDFKNNGGK